MSTTIARPVGIMRRRSSRACVSRVRPELLLLLLLVGACRDASEEPVQSSLSIYGGNNQTGFDTLSNLGSPLAVRVTGDGHAMAYVRVQWKVVVGAGAFTSFPTGSPLVDNTTSTDINGIAAVYFRLRSLGTNTVTASVSGATPVEFHAIANPTLGHQTSLSSPVRSLTALEAWTLPSTGLARTSVIRCL